LAAAISRRPSNGHGDGDSGDESQNAGRDFLVFRPEDSGGLDAADVVSELCRRAGRSQASQDKAGGARRT